MNPRNVLAFFVLVPAALFLGLVAFALVLMWFFWALADVDLTNRALTFSESMTVGAPLLVLLIVFGWLGSSSN